MDNSVALAALGALSQPTRMDAFRLLVQHEPIGMAAGELARKLGVPQNTLSTHLSILAHAEMVVGERQGRTIQYRARIETLHALTLFLVKDCCGGRAEICAPLIAELTPCLKPEDT